MTMTNPQPNDLKLITSVVTSTVKWITNINTNFATVVLHARSLPGVTLTRAVAL